VTQASSCLRPKLLGTTGYPTEPSEPPHLLERVSPLAHPASPRVAPLRSSCVAMGRATPSEGLHVFRVSSPPRERPCTRCRRRAACKGRRLPPLVQRHDRRSPSFAAPRRATLPEGSRVLFTGTTPARATRIAPFRPPGLPLPSRRLDEALLRRGAPLFTSPNWRLVLTDQASSGGSVRPTACAPKCRVEADRSARNGFYDRIRPRADAPTCTLCLRPIASDRDGAMVRRPA